MSTIVIVLVVLLLLGLFAAPTWPYSRSWGYGWWPSGGIGLVLVVLLILFLVGAIPR